MSKIIMISLALIFVGFSTFFLTSEATSESGFASVSKGMTEAQVSNLLGTPHELNHERGSVTYFYGGLRRLKWCTMEIYFDSEGRVASKFHDH